MHKRTKISGFTIVELLIVVVVIAILTAISVVAYTNIQDRTIASAVKPDLANFAKKIELAKIESSDELYPTTINASMGIGVTKSVYQTVGRSNWYYCESGDRSSYALGVVDVKNRGYYITPSGLEEGASGVNNASTLAKAGVSSSYSIIYNWNTTTGAGAWQAWVN